MRNEKLFAEGTSSEKICYIVGAGEFYGELKPDTDDLVIAADGGFDTLTGLGITPDLLLGDMDSIESASDVEKIVFPVRKDETDTFLAYQEGVARGYTNFVVFGGVGGRDDHTFANYSLLIYGKNRGHNIKIIGEKCDIFAIKNEAITVRGKAGNHFSAFAFGGEAHGVTIRGLEYGAENISLSPEFPLAVSNRFLDKDGCVRVKDGTLILMIER